MPLGDQDLVCFVLQIQRVNSQLRHVFNRLRYGLVVWPRDLVSPPTAAPSNNRKHGDASAGDTIRQAQQRFFAAHASHKVFVFPVAHFDRLFPYRVGREQRNDGQSAGGIPSRTLNPQCPSRAFGHLLSLLQSFMRRCSLTQSRGISATLNLFSGWNTSFRLARPNSALEAEPQRISDRQ